MQFSFAAAPLCGWSPRFAISIFVNMSQFLLSFFSKVFRSAVKFHQGCRGPPFMNFFAAKKQKYNGKNKKYLCWADFTHNMCLFFLV